MLEDVPVPGAVEVKPEPETVEMFVAMRAALLRRAKVGPLARIGLKLVRKKMLRSR
jgi:hypothetical protein